MFVAAAASGAASDAARLGLWLAVLLVCLSAVGSTHAAMHLERTRLIVAADEGRAVLHVQSDDAHPLLLQIWIDETEHAHGEPASLPFMADPPVMLLTPGSRRAIQVLRVAPPEALPAEHESLYWLNVLEVPASAPTDPYQGHLQIGVQSRLKLFYRPPALAHYDAAHLPAQEQLRFTQQADLHGQHWLVIDNPAPIHQSLARLSVHARGAPALALPAPMLAPFAQTRLALPPLRAPVQLRFTTIGDNGMPTEHAQPLPAPALSPTSSTS